MITRQRTKVLDEIPNLDDDPRVEAEYEKLAHLNRRRDQIEIDLEAVRGQSPHQRVRDEAAALIAGQAAPSAEEKPVRADLVHSLHVVEEALRIQTAAVETVKGEVAREARVSLTPRRAELLARIDSAVGELVDALTEHEGFVDDCERFDVVRADIRIGSPWLAAPVNGDPKHFIERLKSWRAEYAANQFVVKG